MTQEELALFNEFFAQRFGLFFPDHKREILESRLVPRLRALHLQRFLDYYLLLQYDLAREIEALTRAITNNESYFFRETGQFDALVDHLNAAHDTGARWSDPRVLSAGCSSGEEAYSLNIALRERVANDRLGGLRIDGVDLDSERVEMARIGAYRRMSLRALDDERIRRYFEIQGDERFVLRPQHRLDVQFRSGNILDESLARYGQYDVVFCRNVLIYFSEAALKRAIENFATVVRPGGLLFLGHSESIIGLTSLFRAERLGQTIAYRRVEP
ncbi:MAG: protein-glutamate O-methyltransferase CheR [Acidobacteriota bacterium]